MNESVDAYLADPLHFKSAHQLDQERALLIQHEQAALQRTQARVEKILLTDQRANTNTTTNEEQEQEHEHHHRRRRRRRLLEESHRQLALSQAQQQQQQQAAADIARRRREEALSARTIEVVTRACPGPGCAARIEKDAGCMHMRCASCGHEFCWGCMGPWARGRGCGRCFGDGDGGGDGIDDGEGGDGEGEGEGWGPPGVVWYYP